MISILKLLYLVGLGVGLLFITDLRALAALASAQLVMWCIARVGFRPLLHALRRMAFFFVVVIVSWGLIPGSGDDRWVDLFAGLRLNLGGVVLGVAMSLRVATLVLASGLIQRTGRPGELAEALVQLRLPRSIAHSLDGTLAMLSTDASGGGGGDGRGGGRGKDRALHGAPAAREGLRLSDLRIGRVGLLREHVDRAFESAERALVQRNRSLPPDLAREVTTIAGVSLAAMGLRMLRVLPGLPVAPGHKNVLLVPLFLLASERTRSRLGGLKAGVTVGLASFLLGHGKWGLFEIGHFVAPGLAADLLLPVLGRGNRFRLFRFMLIGGILGATRFASNFLVIVYAGAPWTAFAIYAPMLLSQVVFGALSGFVSVRILDGASNTAAVATEAGLHGKGSDSRE